jgi:hypothetical protein
MRSKNQEIIIYTRQFDAEEKPNKSITLNITTTRYDEERTMIEILLTLEEVEKAVFEALDNVRIPYSEYWEIDKEEIREMPGHKDVIGAFELTPRKDFVIYVELSAGPGMDIIDGKEILGENRNGRNVTVEVTLDDWDTFEMTRWSCKREIDEAVGYVAALWKHRYGGESNN